MSPARFGFSDIARQWMEQLLSSSVERRRLDVGPDPGDQADGVGLVEVVALGGDAAAVLGRVREIIGVVVDRQVGDWLIVDQWPSLLPSWFVEKCADEISQEQAEAWLRWWHSLPDAERAAASSEEPWSLADWLYYFEPAQRHWWWWSAEAESADRLRIEVEVDGWPVPLGSLEWVLRAAGATEVAIGGLCSV